MQFITQSLISLIMLTVGAGWVQAAEAFKDEAGRTIYTIDDDGTVSMFENSTMDFTLSVTRGTREQMDPQITEVSPNAISAGVSTVLKLKGKNLIGASAKLSVPGIELGAHSGKPNSLDIPITVSASIPPGEVILYLTTPVGTTQTSFKVLDLQIGTSAKREVQSRPKISTAAPSSCPGDMTGVSVEFGGFCIDLDRSFMGSFVQAEKTCAIAGKRLCQGLEWTHACQQAKQGNVPVKKYDRGLGMDWFMGSCVREGFNLGHPKSGDGQGRLPEKGQLASVETEKFEGRCCR